MSEEYARYKQYEYKTVCCVISVDLELVLINLQNSNLVLTSENRTSHNNEPTGEVESLWGKMHGKMGDKANFAKPKDLEDKLDKMRKKYPLLWVIFVYDLWLAKANKKRERYRGFK